MDQSVACLLCGRPVDQAERRCAAFGLAGIPAHTGCCGGCATLPGQQGSGAVEASTAAVAMVGEPGG